MVLDFAKEALQNVSTHSISFDDLRAGKANIKVCGVGGAGGPEPRNHPIHQPFE